MSIRHLEGFFQPQTVAVIGASEREGSIGRRVFSNLLNPAYDGQVVAVNIRRDQVLGRPAVARVADLEEVPDLAIVATPLEAVPEVLEALGEKGCRAVIILTVMHTEGAATEEWNQRLLSVAGAYHMRLLGPGCVGLTVPSLGLNASLVQPSLESGALAFLSQSSGMAMAVQHWALERSIGFSHFLSLGDGLDVDLPDLIDYLALDPAARAILIAQNDVERGRKYLSALRAAARVKPVVVVQTDRRLGRRSQVPVSLVRDRRIARWSEQVFDAALRRSGALQVTGVDELFGTAELLAHTRTIQGNRLLVVSNSLAAGLLTRDALTRSDTLRARLVTDIDAPLLERFPSSMVHSGLVNLGRWADSDDLVFALNRLVQSGQVDAVILTLTPNLASELGTMAKAVVTGVEQSSVPILGCFLGGEGARAAAQNFASANWPSFLSPEEVVNAVASLEDYRRNQHSLTELPEPDPLQASLDRERIRAVIRQARSDGVHRLDEVSSKLLLGAAGLEGLPTRIVDSPDKAAEAAAEIEFPVAVKAVLQGSANVLDARLYRLDLPDAASVRQAAERLARQVRLAGYDQIAGYAVQRMIIRPNALHLSLGMHTDAIFGPVIYVGHGGAATLAIADQTLGLPPLNPSLARDLLRRTRIHRQFGIFDRASDAVERQITEAMVCLSELVLAEPSIQSIHINPWLVDEQGLLALDAQVELLAVDEHRRAPAIAPYPASETESIDFQGDEIRLRAIRPEDAQAHAELFNHLEPDDQRYRFFGTFRHPQRSQLARFTQIDYDREMAFVAKTTDQEQRTLGVVRAVRDRSRQSAEFAIVIRSDLKGSGLGRRLMDKIIDYCRRQGMKVLTGQVMEGNHRMLGLARRLGFVIGPSEQGVHEIKLDLTAQE